jgi:uncharacterized protein (DUF1501 family)
MINRRQFLTHSCGLATVTAASSLLQLGLARAAAAQTATDYRALVCILLAGGNDSFNMLVPTDADQYSQYQSIRTDLALPREQLLALAGETATGRSYGLHPGMAGLQQLFAEGDAALLCNVGTLLDPFDAQAVAAGTARPPLGLFSHSDQIQQWQTAISNERGAQGWGGRVADLLQGASPANGISMNISLSGNNIFQSGASVSSYSVEADGDGAVGLNGYNDGTNVGDFRKQFIDSILGVESPHLMRSEYRSRLLGSIEAQQFFAEAMQGAPLLGAEFAADRLSQSLRQIARIISIRDQVAAPRQVFFVTLGGWDHHDNLLDNQATLLPMVSQALLSFRNALDELGVARKVTTFTTSDFGRTLTSNGKGSDHGWGGHHIVMGGAVNGGSFYGDYPEIVPGSPLDVGRGIYAPTTAVDQYFAELALWLGVSPSDLDTVLPNVRSFYSPGSEQMPLGFLS